MNRRWPAVVAVLTLSAAVHAQQPSRTRIDVQDYQVDAEVNPASQTLKANVVVRFIPVDDLNTASFELNNALNVSRIVDGAGNQIAASRNQQDYTVRINFPQTLRKGQPTQLTFTYDGKLTGNEESPVYGIRFAAIRPDTSYLMYPARWIPVNEYTTDRFTADMRIAVPAGYKVIAPGTPSGTDAATGGLTAYRFKFANPSFPASVAVVQGDGQKTSAQGVTSTVYFRERQNMALSYGEEAAKMVSFFTGVYGPLQSPNLTLIETENGTPSGYAAPGIIFFSSRTIGTQLNARALANQVARQWWGVSVSPATRNHLWLTNGNARYAEFLWLENLSGPGALESEVRDTFVEALTVENVPLMQSSRLEDYSPEYWAMTAGKGAAVLQMLRGVVGDDKFKQILQDVTTKRRWGTLTTDEFRKTAETISGQNLQWFFMEWIESTGAPEFKMDYTVFRTSKGFRVMGKVSQDLDTFRMPVEMRIETEGNPEDKKVDVVGTSSEFLVETFGKPRKITLDPNNKVLRFSNPIRVAVAVRRGEQFAEVGEFTQALQEYQKALDVNRNSSIAHYRVAEVFMLQNNYQSAANEFRESLNGDLDPKWTEVWAHINLGKIFDVTGQRERAVNEYKLAERTKDNAQGAQEEIARYLKQPYERQRAANY